MYCTTNNFLNILNKIKHWIGKYALQPCMQKSNTKIPLLKSQSLSYKLEVQNFKLVVYDIYMYM